jgi:serine/threonine-protein kinase RsbW
MLSTCTTATRWSQEIAACHDECRTVRDRLAGALDTHGWDDDDAFRVLVCASEALANAVTHGSRPDDALQVRCTVSATHATMVVLDSGESPAPIPGAVPDDANEHGRGVLLMRALADSLRIRRLPGGTLVALAFRAP